MLTRTSFGITLTRLARNFCKASAIWSGPGALSVACFGFPPQRVGQPQRAAHLQQSRIWTCVDNASDAGKWPSEQFHLLLISLPWIRHVEPHDSVDCRQSVLDYGAHDRPVQ